MATTFKRIRAEKIMSELVDRVNNITKTLDDLRNTIEARPYRVTRMLAELAIKNGDIAVDRFWKIDSALTNDKLAKQMNQVIGVFEEKANYFI